MQLSTPNHDVSLDIYTNIDGFGGHQIWVQDNETFETLIDIHLSDEKLIELRNILNIVIKETENV